MSLARLLTGLLVVTLFVDGISRPLPIDWLAFRPWEAAMRDRPPEAAFEPNLTITCRRCYGDLANMANRRGYRVYRREIFTTDSWGFRNDPDVGQRGRVRMILAGDSFSAGAALSDADTLSAQLGARLGEIVYNTAPMLIGPKGIQVLAERFHISGGVVLFQHLGSTIPPVPGTEGSPPHEQPAVTWPDRFVNSFRTDDRRDQFPLRIVANRAVKFFEDDRILANPYAGLATVDYLSNDQVMLFRTSDIQIWPLGQPPFNTWVPGRIQDTIAYYKWFHDQVASFGLRFVVLLVPTKYTLYRPFLRTTPDGDRVLNPYLSELAAGLQAAGVAAIDVSGVLHGAAKQGLEDRRVIYWPDDTHWNRDGVYAAADHIARALKEMPTR